MTSISNLNLDMVVNITSTGTLSPHSRPLRASIGVSVANMDGLVVVGRPGRSDTCGEHHALNVVLNGGAKHPARLFAHTLPKYAPALIATRVVTH